MNATSKAFYSGILTALNIMDAHGDEVQFDELVCACDLRELVEAAVSDDLFEFSGLAKREYAQQCVHPTAAGVPASADNSESGGGNASRWAAAQEMRNAL